MDQAVGDRAALAAQGDFRALRRVMLRVNLLILALAGACLVAAAIAGVLMARTPDDSLPPVEVTPAMLADGSAPTNRRVMLRGTPVEWARTEVARSLRMGSARWTYTGFRQGARNSASGDSRAGIEGRGAAPITLFTAIWWRPTAATALHGAQDRRQEGERLEGMLVADGLPSDARFLLEQHGVPVAERPYVLLVGQEGPRGSYAWAMGLGLVFAGLFGALGLGMLARTLRMKRPVG